MYFNYSKNKPIIQVEGGIKMIVAICGKSGSGKSTLARQIMELSSKEVVHLNIDEIGHQVLEIPEVQKEIINTFGESILKDKKVSRKKLGEMVFTSRNEMKKLSDITWEYMQAIIDHLLHKHKDKIILLDWILLPITKYFDKCNIKILLDIPYETRKQRAIKRDGIKEDSFNLREQASIDYNEDSFDIVLKSKNKEIVKRLVKLL